VTGFPSTVRPLAGGRTDQAQIKTPLDQDRAAELFRQIVVPHLADGLALARWLAGNSADAEDIVQDACMRALRAIGDYRGGSARAWLLTIVRNTAFSWLAKQRSSSLVMVGDLADIDEVSAAAPSTVDELQPTPESELIRRADQQAVMAAIAALTLPMREVLVLRDVNGFSYKEIAEVLNLPIGTVMSRLARGRQQVATLVKGATP
jgi:RNA polymerase sigma-70 factor, ECF subfamily